MEKINMTNMIKKIIFCSVCGFFLAQGLGASAATYYVARTGCSDSYAGTLASPWCTIAKAKKTVVAGDTVYLRAGTYAEGTYFDVSGTQANPINVMAYSGETPVIDGTGVTQIWLTGMKDYSLLELKGNYLNFSGIEVRNSSGMGVDITGNYDTVSNFNSHNNHDNGIHIEGSYDTIQNSQVWQNSMNNVNGTTTDYWSGGTGACSLSGGIKGNIIRGNTVYDNWGEGLGNCGDDGTVVQDNVVYDNWAANIYISDSTNNLVQRNISYCTSAGTAYTSKRSTPGILLGDELYNPASSNNTIVNNLIVGCPQNFVFWGGNNGASLVNDLIAYNTFVNNIPVQSYDSNVSLTAGLANSNTKIIDNIIEQDSGKNISSFGSISGIAFANNLWSVKPSSGSSSTDVVGDPKLVKTGTIAPGTLTADYFKLQSTSPAINKGSVISTVTTDYAGASRGSSPDIGAFEYAGSTCTPTTCTAQGYVCGTASDGCGNTLNCGTCSTGTCTNNKCVTSCTPKTCSGLGYTCGTASDGCSGTLNCGTCTYGSCTSNKCVCTPTTCSAQSATCGSISDGCGNTLNCGTCSTGTCTNNKCVTSSGPVLAFVSPTDASGATITRTYTQPSVTATTSALNTFAFNWNGISYPIYDSSLVLGLNFNNNSSIGESSTKFIDISKAANICSCSGTACPAYTSSGEFGGAYTFNGSSKYITCGSAANLNPTNALTIEAWIKPSSLSGERAIVHKQNWVNMTGYYLETDAKKAEFALGNGTNISLTGNTSLLTGTWYHIAGVLSNGIMTLYVNGKSDGTKAFTGTIKTGTESLLVGKNAYWNGEYFNGSIDEVRVYNRALSANEIAMQYQSEFKKVTASSWQFSDTVSGLASGTYSYSATATDTANNTGSTETRTLTVNTGTASSSSSAQVASLAETTNSAAPTIDVASQTQNSSIQAQIEYIQQRIRELMASIQASIALGLAQ